MKAIKILKKPSIAASAGILLNLGQIARADIICWKKNTGEKIFAAITLSATDTQHPLEVPVVGVLATSTKRISLAGSMHDQGTRLYVSEVYTTKDSEGNDAIIKWVKSSPCQFTRPGCDYDWPIKSYLKYEESEFEITCESTKFLD